MHTTVSGLSALPVLNVAQPSPAPTDVGIFVPPARGRIYDMELGGHHEATVRHDVENCLASFCAALDGGDEDAFLELFRRTPISLNGALPAHAQADLASLYRILAPPVHTRSVHVFHNLQIRMEGNEARYTAIFQRWAAGGSPSCISIGYFSGCMTAGPQVWYWTRHSITSAATGRRDGI
ncbi:nuclear transport factor 2 family protein [Arthrobacter sp. MI7-26]|uniref:nuclear transport factor 2 family protein n=1 Tax=Arthrobacter sp. MI7-26 TaxID=2993653 RepID=UPI0022487728|nr:nuclear transport factor 2 family protein [Arthrobacter sp. MI7-26]MCX2748710.1 nuclear transport factor 2 family protein [Arthrobacter sp. MI7-26]